MNFNLYFELGTRSQGTGLLELLSLPADEDFGGHAEWSAEWWGHGKTTRFRSTQRGSIVSKLAQSGFNEMQLRGHFETSPTGDPSLRSARTLLNLSAMSTLWAAVPQEACKNPVEDRNRRNFVGHESVRTAGYTKSYPSIAEYTLEFESKEGSDDSSLQSLAIRLLQSSLRRMSGLKDLFGYGCVHGTCRREMMLHSLGGNVAWTDQLGEKFENIYPIIVGPTRSCEGLVEALSDAATLIRISDELPFAIVSISPERVQEARINPKVRDWVVIRQLKDLKARPEVIDQIFKRYSSIPELVPFVSRD